MNMIHRILKNVIFTVIVLGVFFCLSLWVETVFQTYSPIPALFALAVFFISLITDGYIYGIIASLVSVLALNFAFTFPYFKFNFTIPENMVSAVIMLSITIISSTLTTKMRNIEKLRTENEKEKMRANLLHSVSHDLRSPLTTIYGSSSAIVEQYDSLSEVKLTQTEYNIVQLLSIYAGRVLTYSEIIKRIWGYSDIGSIKKLQVNMANIRKKLGEKPGENRFISNELGVGYRMNSPEAS